MKNNLIGPILAGIAMVFIGKSMAQNNGSTNTNPAPNPNPTPDPYTPPAPTYTPPPPTKTVNDSFPLRVGSYGPNVTKLQTLLKKVGLYNYTIDADFGNITLQAVRAYFSRPEKTTVESWDLGQMEYNINVYPTLPKTAPKPTTSNQPWNYKGFGLGVKVFSKGNNTFDVTVAANVPASQMWKNVFTAGRWNTWKNLSLKLSFKGGQVVGLFTGRIDTAGRMLVLLVPESEFSKFRSDSIVIWKYGVWCKPEQLIK